MATLQDPDEAEELELELEAEELELELEAEDDELQTTPTKPPATFVPIATFNCVPSDHTTDLDPCVSENTRMCPKKGTMIRVIGKLHIYNILTSRMWIQDCVDPSLTLVIDTSRIEPFAYREGGLFQFIGELGEEEIEGKTTFVLRTLLHRCVDGLDMSVYLDAYAVRMKDLGKD